jgi:hypothetical protein
MLGTAEVMVVARPYAGMRAFQWVQSCSSPIATEERARGATKATHGTVVKDPDKCEVYSLRNWEVMPVPIVIHIGYTRFDEVLIGEMHSP